ncbi:MAG: lamin tail domain-containing protein [Bacteroidales bacterium]|nr:lamin tail domain-containing protein [Bacteroidales bacterium]
MFRIIIYLLLLLTAGTALAQDVRNYLTYDFNSVSSWKQGRSNFVSRNGCLSDTSTVLGTDVISRKVDGFFPEDGDTFWRISLACGYENSSVNNFQFYLTANGDNPYAEDFCGMAIGTGFKPNYKALSLIYRHDGIVEVLGTTDLTITKNQENIIDIMRSASGAWTIGDTEVYVPDLPYYSAANHIAVTFTFNKTGAKQFGFQFNSFSQNNNSIDIPATINDANIIDPTTLKINVSGRMDVNDVVNTANYSVCGIHPAAVDFNYYNIMLHYPDTIPNKGDIVLVANGLRDGYGNKMDKFQRTFHQALPAEIVVNEIMVDVNPMPYSLPAKKFVELYNTSDTDFDLEGYVFSIDDAEYDIPAVAIKADGYIILASDETTFAQYGECVEAFQESKLTVGGKHIALINRIGAVVDSLTYSEDFYNDKDRNSGGFSMERLDPYNNCNGTLNWHASSDLSGGTPGRKNSVYEIYEDNTVPDIVGCTLLTNSSLRLDFTENISQTDFTIGGNHPLSATIKDQSVFYTMSKPFKDGFTTIKGYAVDACGTQSDVLATEIHYTPFEVESVYAVSSYQVVVNFSTAVSTIENECFTLDNGAMPSLNEAINDDESNSVLLTFADDFEPDAKLRLSIDGVENSIHDRIANQNFSFRYHRVGEGDILINEVLYYPNVGMKRYVELYNNSDDDIFLFGLSLSGYTAAGDLLRSCTVDGYALLPAGGFAVVAADTANVALNYNAKGVLLEASRFPSLNTSRGYVSLRSADGVLLDSMYYDNSMQSALLANKRGVALERIAADAPSMDANNWTSASELYGFATPGFVNSCAKDADLPEENMETQELADEAVTIENRLMRPGDSDGEFSITFHFDRPMDPLLSVTVYDSNGREVRCIASEIMAFRGCNVTWDGRDRHGSCCKSGIYVVFIKAVDDTGWSFTRKEACVIGNFR